MRSRTSLFLLLLVFGIAAVSGSSAQVLYGTITGNVTDPSGAVVPGVKVTVENERTNQTRDVVTGQSGSYNFSDLLAGTYTVSASAQGFETFVQHSAELSANSSLRVDVGLRAGASEVVTVSSAMPLLQTDRTDLRSELSTVTLENAPVPVGRNYQNLLRTLPGVSVSGGGTIRGSNPAGSLTMNANGKPSTSNSTTIDGAISSDTYDSTKVAYIPTLDAIESIDIVTNSFTAETTLAGGAAVSIHVKSGTNSLHGTAFNDFANSSLQAYPAVNPLQTGKPNYTYDQYGGSLGGPIKKNKVFFFGSFDGIFWNQTYTATTTVPTDAMKAGDLSGSPTAIYNPATGTSTGKSRTAFAGNQITHIDPITAKILPLIPEPNLSGIANNYFASGASPYRRYTGDGKITWNINNHMSAFVRTGTTRFNQYNATDFGPAIGGPAIDGQQPGTASGGVDSVTAALTYLFKPNLIIDGYFGYTRNVQNAQQDRLSEQLGLNYLGIPGTNGPRYFEGGWPLFSLESFTSLGQQADGEPWFRTEPSYEYTSNLNWTRGRHNIRAGVDFSIRDLSFIQPNVVGNSFPGSGGFDFNDGGTELNGGPAGNQYNSFASFLLGLPEQNGRTDQIPDSYSYLSHFFGFYGQDQWNIFPKLTLTAGVRWDYYPLGRRGDRGLETYNSTTDVMNICGIADVPANCSVAVSKTMFSPRLGVAFRPTERMVVRAGSAISYDPYDIIPQDGFQNFPVIIASDNSSASSYITVGQWATGIPALAAPNISSGHVAVPNSVIIYTPPTQLRRGYIESWNLSVQQDLGGGFVSQISYVGNHGVRLMGVRDENAGQVIGAGAAGQPLDPTFGRTASTYLATPMYSSTYNALQVTLQKRLSGGLQINSNYTWSKAISDNNGSGFVAALPYFHLNRARVNFNRANVFNLLGIYQLPFGKNKRWLTHGLVSKLAGGWQLNPVFTAESGIPFTVTSSSTSLNMPGSTQFANQVAPVQILGGHRAGNAYFSQTSFRAVTTASFGNAGFDSLTGPGLMDLDMGLFRSFDLTDRFRLQFRVEAFNATNTPHWALPASNVSNLVLNTDGSIKSTGGFGEITSTDASTLGRSGTDQRTYRLGAHLFF